MGPSRAAVAAALAAFALAVPPAAGRSAGGREDLDPTVAAAARWAVAIEVEREEDDPAPLSRAGKARARLPQDVVDYYRRPPGPATGVLLDGAANVLTTHYNLSGKLRAIRVVLPDGRKVPARLVAGDRSDDLALIRTDAPIGSEVPPVPWASADSLRVGRMVFAIGRSPDPARPTATSGIISALGRNGGRAFQTDAKLNYGNVGGPITDLDGGIVGIAAFVGHIYPMWGLNSGIGFGTRADTIRSVLPTLLAGKDIPAPEQPFLGVGMSEEPAEGGTGAPIGRVERGSGADAAGVKPGDVVLAIDGESLDDFMDLRRIIGRRRPGDEVTLRVQRKGEILELKARIQKRPE